MADALTPADRLKALDVEEVLLALPDPHGRLAGVRLATPFVLDEVLWSGYGACAYLLTADVDMRVGEDPVLRRHTGAYGDLVLCPDPDTLRVLPWEDSTALMLADPYDHRWEPIETAPRAVLRRQIERLAARGLVASVGTELEVLMFAESYGEAHRRGYAGLSPLTRFNADYAVTGTREAEAVARRIRRAMTAAGLAVESARGECHPGQYEIVFRHSDPLTACDNHVVYKTGAAAIAADAGVALTFMPLYDSGAGSSCHVHLSLSSTSGDPVMAGDGDERGFSPLMHRAIGGLLEAMPELTLLAAPSVNAYSRLRSGEFAPREVRWGVDDRTAPLRVVGSGRSLRVEYRVAGGDANPYLLVAGMLAAILHGLETGSEPPGAGEVVGPPLPGALWEAVPLFAASKMAADAFGAEVVDLYAGLARAELEAFASTVTDLERARGFERR